MKLPEVMAATHRSRPSIYRDMKQGQFPASVMLGRRSVAWREKDIEEWLATRPTSAAAKGPVWLRKIIEN